MAFNQLKKWVGTQLWSTFMTEYNENIDELNRVIDGVDTHLAESAHISQYNALGSVPYESADNRWRDLSGVGFYYAGTSNVGYPQATGILMHFRLSSATSITWQMFLGNSGQVWTRRGTASANFADVEWVAV